MKLGCPTTRTILRICGWMTCTVGGVETLLTSTLCSWWQPAAARANSRPKASWRRLPGRAEDTGQGERRIGYLWVRGRSAGTAAPVGFRSWVCDQDARVDV